MELFFIVLLAFTSVVGVAFIVERGIALRWRRVIPLEVELAVENFNPPANLEAFERTCHRNPSALSRVLMVGVNHLTWPRTENVDAMQTRARHELMQLERGLVILEIIVGIAPLLGLVGTIYGLILLFGDYGSGELLDKTSAFSRGIAVALRATLMGLLIAIPALISWSYYSKKLETLAIEMEALCGEFLRRHYHKDEPD